MVEPLNQLWIRFLNKKSCSTQTGFSKPRMQNYGLLMLVKVTEMCKKQHRKDVH